MPPHEFSLAQPKRLFVDHDEDGFPVHVLAGEHVRDGTLLLLQIVDGTWIPGSFHVDLPPMDPAAPWAPPRFRIHLADPLAKPEPRSRAPGTLVASAVGSAVADHPDPLSVEFELPPDAVLRIHPAWKRLMNPRPARNRQRRRTS